MLTFKMDTRPIQALRRLIHKTTLIASHLNNKNDTNDGNDDGSKDIDGMRWRFECVSGF